MRGSSVTRLSLTKHPLAVKVGGRPFRLLRRTPVAIAPQHDQAVKKHR